MSQSDVFNTTWEQHKRVIHGAFGIGWDGKFDKLTETRWMVTWRTAAVLEGGRDQVLWLATEHRANCSGTRL